MSTRVQAPFISDPPGDLILDSLGLPMVVVDCQCRILRVNRSAEQLIGSLGTSLSGLRCSEVLNASLCRSSCPARAALRSGETCHFGSVIVQTRARPALTVDVTASALRDRRGRLIGAVELLRDVSEGAGLVRVYGRRTLVSRTVAMRRIFDALPRLSASRAPLLIVGRVGTGRSALAEMIHELVAARAGLGLVRLSCSAVAAAGVSLLAAQQRLRAAPGATFLVEDVCRAAPALQAQLLAWLEEDDRAPGVRLICTASERLPELVERGAFRQDLYYRINVLHVALPTLEERVEDIPLIVEQILDDLNLRSGRDVEGLTVEAMRTLLDESFPASIRKLRQIIEEAHARCRGRLIGVAELSVAALREGSAAGEMSAGSDASHAQGTTARHRRATADEEIQAAIARCGGNVSRAARELGVHRTTLWRRLQAKRRRGSH